MAENMEQQQTQQDKGLSVEAVKAFIEQNKDNSEIRDTLSPLFVNYESVDAFLNGNDGAKVLQPRLDRHFTKGLETWKANNLQTIIDTKVSELYPAESSADKKVREMQDRLNKMETERNRASAKATAVQELTERNMPTALADYLVADSMESTRDRINAFESEWAMALKSNVEQRLKGMGGTPKAADTGNSGKDGLTKRGLANMTYEERLAVYKSNPQLFNQIMNG